MLMLERIHRSNQKQDEIAHSLVPGLAKSATAVLCEQGHALFWPVPAVHRYFCIEPAFLIPRSEAGSLATDFDPSQTLPGILYGSAATSPNGGAPNGTATSLQFDTLNGQTGLFVVDEVDPGLQVESFVASFDLLMGNNGSALHGNGFSISFVPAAEVPQAEFPRPYLGTGSGLKIAFVTYNHQVVTNEATLRPLTSLSTPSRGTVGRWSPPT